MMPIPSLRCPSFGPKRLNEDSRWQSPTPLQERIAFPRKTRDRLPACGLSALTWLRGYPAILSGGCTPWIISE